MGAVSLVASIYEDKTLQIKIGGAVRESAAAQLS